MVFNMFINIWDDRTESILNRFAGNTKLSDDMDKFEGRAMITQRLGRAGRVD